MDVASEVNTARQLIQMGRISEGVASCRRALYADPANPDASYLLGIVLLQQGDAPAAAPHLITAAQGYPNNAEVHANLGHTLRAIGRLDEAAAALERAVAIRPDYAQAFNNLGMVRRAQGKLADAEAAYRQALSLIPNLVAANFNVGNVLMEMKRYPEAVTAYRKLISLVPSNPDAHACLGGALDGVNDLPSAREEYEAALQIDPNHATALTNLGLLMRKLGRPEDSLQYLRRGARANPNSPDIQEKLGRGLWDAGMYDEGLRHFQRAIQMRPAPATRIAAATLVPPVYTSNDQVLRWRERLVSEVGRLRAEGVTFDLTHQTARAPFYVPYAGLQDRDVLREIALLHRAPPEPALSRQAASDSRVRVGFLSSFFKDHTVGLWTQGVIATLPRERFHVTVISTQRHEDNVARFIRAQADAHVDLPAALPAARERVGSLGLDVLVYADIGMEPTTYTLAFSRLAPAQCAMWGHPATSGIATVDYFISSELAETAADPRGNYTEKLVALKNLPLFYYRPPPASQRTRESFGLTADAHVYGCLHSTFKLHPQFDAVLAGIVDADPAAIVLVPRTGASNWDRMVLDRLRAAHGNGVAERIRFIDRLSRDDFAALNKACDVTLAPFPFGAGDTSLIALAEGVPVVTLATDYLRGNFTAAMYRAMGWTDLIADTPQHYVQIATGLANDGDRRREVGQTILSKNSVLFENPAGVNELADFLLSAAAT